MQMIPECIRDILLVVEDVSTIDNGCYITPTNQNRYSKLNKYDPDTVLYHVQICLMSNYLYLHENHKNTVRPHSYNVDLTPKGHEFLANVRSDTVWNKTLTVAGKIGSYSLDLISKIAANVLSEFVKQYLGSPIFS